MPAKKRGDDTRVPKMAEMIAGDLRHKILSGELPVGESIREAELIERYEISRPTMREAVRLLEMEQLITVRRGSHRGSVVRLPDTSVSVRAITMLLQLRGATLADIYTARSIFEPPAARLCALHASDDEIASLRATLDEELQAIEDGVVTFPLVAWRFHTQMVELSGNATLAVMASALEQISQRHAEQVTRSQPDNEAFTRNAARAHRKMVALIEARDGETAEAYWREHMRLAGRRLLDGVGDQAIITVLD